MLRTRRTSPHNSSAIAISVGLSKGFDGLQQTTRDNLQDFLFEMGITNLTVSDSPRGIQIKPYSEETRAQVHALTRDKSRRFVQTGYGSYEFDGTGIQLV